MTRRIEVYFGVRWPVFILEPQHLRVCENPPVMTDWIRKGLGKEQDTKLAKEQTDSLQLHRANVIKAKARDLLDQLVEVVGRHVAEHTEQAEADQRFTFTRKPSGGFSLSRLTYPASEMTCVLDLPAAKIVAQGSTTMKRGDPTRNSKRWFAINVDQNDNLYLTNENGGGYASLEDVSKDLIEPVLFPSR